MNDKIKLILALQQVSNLVKLIEGNEYEKYLNFKLNSIYYELQRQISLLD